MALTAVKRAQVQAGSTGAGLTDAPCRLPGRRWRQWTPAWTDRVCLAPPASQMSCCMCVCVCARACVHMYVYVHVDVHVQACTRSRVCACVCVNVNASTHASGRQCGGETS